MSNATKTVTVAGSGVLSTALSEQNSEIHARNVARVRGEMGAIANAKAIIKTQEKVIADSQKRIRDYDGELALTAKDVQG